MGDAAGRGSETCGGSVMRGVMRAAGRGVTMGWRIALRGAGSWGIGGLGGELSHLAFVKFTWSLPLLIIKQLTQEKGAGEDNLVPPGTAMCLGVA